MEFPFLETLEGNWQDILEELDDLLFDEVEKGTDHFTKWREPELYLGDWDVFALYDWDKKVEEHCEMCPKTTKLVEQIPGLKTAGFSALAPHTHIKPHQGYEENPVYRGHLGLIVPKPKESCWLRVDETTYHWEPGKAFVFDDHQWHEAHNEGDSWRFILLFDFLRP